MPLTRRTLLLSGLHATALCAAGPALARASRAAAPRGDRVVLLVELTGGNDGLNTVVPHAQDAYYRLRPSISVAPNAAHRLDDAVALHPSLGRLAEHYREGRLGIVHGVGFPGADRSHFRSLEVWHTGRAPSQVPDLGLVAKRTTGWVGRAASLLGRQVGADPAAIHVGAGPAPLALFDAGRPPATLPDGSALALPDLGADFAAARRAAAGGDGPGELAFVRRTARAAEDLSRRLEAAADRPAASGFPGDDLGRSLELVSRLVTAGLGTRVYWTSIGGFDTHAKQAPSHAGLLARLDEALGAFQRSLGEHAPRVVTVVYSEFGRRTAENGSRGTDHGAGAPVLVLGEGVAAGQHGPVPDLGALVDGDVPHAVDFRSVYAALERDWLGIEPASALPPAPILRT